MRIKDEAIGGLSAGIIGTVIGYPLDLVKTRMQATGAKGGIAQVTRNVIRNGEHEKIM